MDFASNSTDWIYGALQGQPLDTDSQTTPFNIHSATGDVTFDSSALGGSNASPFGSIPLNAGSASATSKQQKSQKMVLALHCIFALVVFCITFPIGGIMIRLMSFRGLLWLHGIWQSVSYIFFIISAGLGICMANFYVSNACCSVSGLLTRLGSYDGATCHYRHFASCVWLLSSTSRISSSQRLR